MSNQKNVENSLYKVNLFDIIQSYNKEIAIQHLKFFTKQVLFSIVYVKLPFFLDILVTLVTFFVYNKV